MVDISMLKPGSSVVDSASDIFPFIMLIGENLTGIICPTHDPRYDVLILVPGSFSLKLQVGWKLI